MPNTLENLVIASEELSQAALALREAVATDRRIRRWIFGLVIGLVVLQLSQFVILGVVINISQDVKNTSTANNETLELMRSATTPGGKLYEQGQKGTQDAVCALIEDNRKLHGISAPCNEPIKPVAPASTNIYRDNEGNCFSLPSSRAEELGLTPDPTCVTG